MAARNVGDSFGGFRSRLVEELRGKGIEDLAVLHAFAEVPRHLFVPAALTNRAYEDTSLPIGWGQTISQPSTQAAYLTALALTGRERVLEVGTGSGYQAALLAHLVDHVVTVERIGELVQSAKRALEAAGVRNVLVLAGDGTLGWRPLAPYDAIVVAAASGPSVPPPLLNQLCEGGRLVAPVTRDGRQVLVRVTQRAGAFHEEALGPAQFVPLVGRHGSNTAPGNGARDRGAG